MGVGITKIIVAIVALERATVTPGMAPVFFAQNEEEQERMAEYLSRTLDAVVHSLDNGVYFLVRH